MPLNGGEIFAGFTIVRLLGSGGMGGSWSIFGCRALVSIQLPSTQMILPRAP